VGAGIVTKADNICDTNYCIVKKINKNNQKLKLMAITSGHFNSSFVAVDVNVN